MHSSALPLPMAALPHSSPHAQFFSPSHSTAGVHGRFHGEDKEMVREF